MAYLLWKRLKQCFNDQWTAKDGRTNLYKSNPIKYKTQREKNYIKNWQASFSMFRAKFVYSDTDVIHITYLFKVLCLKLDKYTMEYLKNAFKINNFRRFWKDRNEKLLSD